jgi:hypothetical protein
MGHYDKYYEEQDRREAIDINKRIDTEANSIRIDIKDYYHRRFTSLEEKGIELKHNMINKLAECRVTGFKGQQLNDLLTEIVKAFH